MRPDVRTLKDIEQPEDVDQTSKRPVDRTNTRLDDRSAPTSSITVRTYFQNGKESALLDLGREVSSALRKQLDQELLETGRPFRTGGPLGQACLPLAGAGAAMATSLSAGNVFVATASPATLMGIHGGLGSAIMGPAGIVGHAPFVPAVGAIMPVVAPVLLLTTLSSMTMAVRFDRIEKTLDSLAQGLSYLLENRIAEDAARFRSAWERLLDIHGEYSKGPGFTEEMKMRLALVERDMNILRRKHHFLAKRNVDNLAKWVNDQAAATKDRVATAKLSKNDRRLFMASSAADVEVDQLRLLLALQDNPADASRRASALQTKVQKYKDDFRSLEEKDEELRSRLRKTVGEMNWWSRRVLRKDKARKDVLSELECKIGLDAPNESAGAERFSILFWRGNDGAGEVQAWCTADYYLEVPEASSPPPPPP